MIQYLESLPLHRIVKSLGGPPRNAVAFTGYPRQHPSEKGKIILVHDPVGFNPTVLEFSLEDVLYAEEGHSQVTETGEGVPLVTLWMRRGAPGMILEPFEVDEPLRFVNRRQDLRERFFPGVPGTEETGPEAVRTSP
jgi:hypothetical protein